MPNAKRTQQAVKSAQAAIDLNMKQKSLFHLLILLIEWCEVHQIDFDAAVSEVRQHLTETA